LNTLCAVRNPSIPRWPKPNPFAAGSVPIAKVQTRRDEDGVWIAKSTLLPGCHAHGHDRGEAIPRFQEAAKAHLETLLETGRPIPPAFRDKFVLAA